MSAVRKPVETEGRKPLPIPAADMLAALLDRADLLVVDGRPFLLVAVSPPMLDRLAEVGADEREPDDFGEDDDPREEDDWPEDGADAEPTGDDFMPTDQPRLRLVRVTIDGRDPRKPNGRWHFVPVSRGGRVGHG